VHRLKLHVRVLDHGEHVHDHDHGHRDEPNRQSHHLQQAPQ